jgi:hypothetical protein
MNPTHKTLLSGPALYAAVARRENYEQPLNITPPNDQLKPFAAVNNQPHASDQEAAKHALGRVA